VDPEQWGQGVGRRLWERLAQRLSDLGALRVYGVVREDLPGSRAWAERRGFVPTGNADRESRLDVRRANLDGFEGVEDQLKREGIRIATVAQIGLDDEAFLRRLHAMEVAAIRDIPTSETIASDPIPYDLWKGEMFGTPWRSADTFWVALDGDEPVGLARLRVFETAPAAYNGFTATAAAYRGRGIARALKLRTIQWCREQGIDYIYTGNHVENRRMLDINIRLGYQPLPGGIELVKDL
jgi:GNAT superfamily N-acetyltransferase